MWRFHYISALHLRLRVGGVRFRLVVTVLKHV